MVAPATDHSGYVLLLVPLGYQEVDSESLHPADKSTVAVLSKETLVDVLDSSQSYIRPRLRDNHRQRGLEIMMLAKRAFKRCYLERSVVSIFIWEY